MPGFRRYIGVIRSSGALFVAVACLVAACASAIPSATPTPTLLPATFTPVASAGRTPSAVPAATASPTTVDLAAVLNTALQKLTTTGLFRGSVLVALNGQVILSQGFGMADQAKQTANTPQTKFRLYSVTKQFTAMAIMLLQERSKLSVQDKICKYLTDCPSAWQPITIHQLLTHTSGIPDTQDVHVQGDVTSPLPLAKMIADAKTQPLAFPPGSQYSYDNMGYILLGKIIETASGQTYETFVMQNVFEPLRMTHTDYDFNRPDVAVGYTNPNVAADPVNMWVPFSAGGLDSTVGDLYLWDQALYTDTLVPQKVVDSIFTPYVVDTDFPTGFNFGYGYGWIIGTDHNRRVFFHAGGAPGFATFIARYPDDKMTIIILSNLENADVNDISLTLAQKVFSR